MRMKRVGLKPSGVYFLRCGNRVKVGASKTVQIRLQNLTAQATEAELLGVLGVRCLWDAEKAIHRRLAPYRLRGEWYAVSPDLLAEIQQILTDPLVAEKWNGPRGSSAHLGRP